MYKNRLIILENKIDTNTPEGRRRAFLAPLEKLYDNLIATDDVNLKERNVDIGLPEASAKFLVDVYKMIDLENLPEKIKSNRKYYNLFKSGSASGFFANNPRIFVEFINHVILTDELYDKYDIDFNTLNGSSKLISKDAPEEEMEQVISQEISSLESPFDTPFAEDGNYVTYTSQGKGTVYNLRNFYQVYYANDPVYEKLSERAKDELTKIGSGSLVPSWCTFSNRDFAYSQTHLNSDTWFVTFSKKPLLEMIHLIYPSVNRRYSLNDFKEYVATDEGFDWLDSFLKHGPTRDYDTIYKTVAENYLLDTTGNSPEGARNYGYHSFKNSPGSGSTFNEISGILLSPRPTYSYTGEILKSVEIIKGKLVKWSENVETVRVPEGVISIEPGAFNSLSRVSTVYLPSTTTMIKEGAFRNVRNLRTVVVTNALEVVALRAFDNIASLTLGVPVYDGQGTPRKFVAPKRLRYFPEVYTRLTNFRDDSFKFRNDLSKSDLNDNSYAISRPLYSQDSGYNIEDSILTNVTLGAMSEERREVFNIPFGVTTILPEVASRRLPKKLVFPESFVAIPEYGFRGSNVQEVDFKACKNLTVIPKGAFENSALEKIELPRNGAVHTIGEDAFKQTRELKQIFLGMGIRTIEDNAFRGIIGLNRVILPVGRIIRESGTIGNRIFDDSLANLEIVTDNAEWLKSAIEVGTHQWKENLKNRIVQSGEVVEPNAPLLSNVSEEPVVAQPTPQPEEQVEEPVVAQEPQPEELAEGGN